MKDPKPWTKRIYEDTADVLKASRQGKIIAKGSESEWIAHPSAESTGSRNKMLVTPKAGFDTELSMFLEELPPGGNNNKHRHYLYAIKYIISGKGHEILDGKRYNYEEGDAVFIPPGSWHQSFNDDKKKPLVFLAAATHMRLPILDDLMDEGL